MAGKMGIMRLFEFVVLLTALFWCVPSSSSHETVTGHEFDDSYFSNLGKTFVGSPPLLQSLAGKEEVIYIIMNHFKEELLKGVQSGNETEEAGLQKSVVPATELDKVESYLKDFEETTGRLTRDYTTKNIPFRAYDVAWNPLATYHMIRRFSVELKRFLKNMDSHKEPNFRVQNLIYSVMRDLGWPSAEDMRSIMSGIIRVQHVYNMNTDDIARGNIHGRETHLTLSGSDCHELGKYSLVEEQYALAVEWLEMATEKLRNETSSSSSTAERDLSRAIEAHDKKWDTTAGWEHQYFVNKLSEFPMPKDRVKRRKVQFDTFKGGKTSNFNEINFWGLCDGENYQTEDAKKKLFCWYEKEMMNAWLINPIKAELVSLNPLIVQYYEVVGNKLADKIKREASPSLVRSTVIDDSNGSSKKSAQRTSLSAWIPDIFRDEFSTVSRRIELITGLTVSKVTAAEDLQIASYAFGGHYEVHMDALRLKKEVLGRGDRIATFMVYLSDVEKGGSTAFPIAGVAAKPVRGSAVFWYNLYNSGEPDERTWHGACPVILGEKWVANKWIRMYDQMHSHQCHTKVQASFDFKVNGKKLGFVN